MQNLQHLNPDSMDFVGATAVSTARPLNLFTWPEITLTACANGDWSRPILVSNPSPSNLYASYRDKERRPQGRKIGANIVRYSIHTENQFSASSIYEMFRTTYPDFDIMVRAVKPSALYPPKENCFDVLIKGPTIGIPLRPILTELVVVLRHANRYPTYMIPIMDKQLEAKGIGYIPGALSPKAIKTCANFASNLRQVFNLGPVITKTTCISSPVDRCMETASMVLQGLDLTCLVNPQPLLRAIPRYNSALITITPEIEELYGLSSSVLDRVMAICDLPGRVSDQIGTIDAVAKLSRAIIIYEDLGVDVGATLGPKLYAELKMVGSTAYNWIYRWQSEHNQELIKDVLQTIEQTPGKFKLCSTHDSIMFMLAQHFRLEYGYPTDLEAPGYLACLMFVRMSDGSHDIYFNNTRLN